MKFRIPFLSFKVAAEASCAVAAAVLIGEETGLHFVYTGNLTGTLCREHTDCPNCGTRLVSRHGFAVAENRLEKGVCPQCGTAVAGRWNR